MIQRVDATPWNRRLVLACSLATCTALFACSEDNAPAPSVAADPIAAYEALSAQLEACEADEAACIAAAAGDPAWLADCDAAANSCKDEARPAEARAKDSLKHGARKCRDDDDAGVDDDDAGASSGNRHGCIERRLPNLRQCVRELIVCLDAADFLQPNASPAALDACFDAGHACFLDELSAWRSARRNRARDDAPAAAGGTAGMSGAATAGGAGASADSNDDDEDDDEAGREERGQRDRNPFDRRQRRSRPDRSR